MEALRLPDEWGGACWGTKITSPDDADGIGRQVAVHSKRRLPYELNWVATLIESDAPTRWLIAASGELTGWGEWMLKQNGSLVDARDDWPVTTDMPILRALSPLLAPVFAWNHHWVMAQGKAGLQQELVRRKVPVA